MIDWRNIIIWGGIPLLTFSLWTLAYIGARCLLSGTCAL